MRTEIIGGGWPDADPLGPTAAPMKGVGHGRLGPEARVRLRWSSLPLHARLTVLGLVGLAGAAGVGYLTSKNPYASPQQISVAVRASVVMTLVLTGIYAQTNRLQARMGAMLIAAGFFSIAWLLNGSAKPLPFTVGAMASGIAPVVFYVLLLSHPQGQLPSEREKRLLVAAGQVLLLLWLALMLISPRAPLSSPLMRCGDRCAENLLFLGPRLPALHAALTGLVTVTWLVLTLAVAFQLVRRFRTTTGLMRAALSPVVLASLIIPVLVIGYVILHAAGSPAAQYVGAAYVTTGILIPMAILSGLSRERVYVAAALAEFVSDLALGPSGDPQAMMASMLGDPSLQISYRRLTGGGYVTLDGTPVTPDREEPGREVTLVERDGSAVAAVTYSSGLRGQERFIQAAASAALMRIESAQLKADLRASTAELHASRMRLVDAADEERRRIERDLHDMVQQQLVGLRLNVGVAADALKDEPERTERMLGVVEAQIDDVLATLRNLARGIYPALLGERGIVTALRADAQRLPIAVAVRGRQISRYPEELEVAVYFCCLEALQNVVKHGGPDASATAHLWPDGAQLRFEIRDNGVGFDPESVSAGMGLSNMHDRIEVVGGTLKVRSQPGQGTRISGSVPAQDRGLTRSG